LGDLLYLVSALGQSSSPEEYVDEGVEKTGEGEMLCRADSEGVGVACSVGDFKLE